MTSMTSSGRHDPSFPGLHIRPESGWVNDPNGVSLIDGRYHVFFQYNPDAPVHEAVVWGHASSTDLLTWDYHPIALRRRPGMIDALGCWSGCVVDDHGVPTAVYSAVRERAGDATVALARSDRQLIDWRQADDAVIGPPDRDGVTEARDPYVFVRDGRRYAVQGAGAPDGDPSILLYACDDLQRWTELEPLLDHTDPIASEVAPASIWECPNLFPLDGRWVLIISSLRSGRLVGSHYLIGDLQSAGDGLHFTVESGGDLDTGSSFYAPQVLSTPDRVLLWGWARGIDRPAEDVHASGWAGALTFPRELSIREGRLISRPAAELDGLRGPELPVGEPIGGHRFEVRAAAGLRLLLDGVEHPVITEDGPVRVFVDGSVIEVFRADGGAETVRCYPMAGAGWQTEGTGLAINELRLPGAA